MDVSLLLIAHAPYLRRAGRQHFGEEYLHRLIARGLIPLINSLNELQAAGGKPRIALACSPILLEQLIDPVVQKHFVLWIEDRLARRTAELQELEQQNDAHRAYLARFYLEWDRRILGSFIDRHERNLGRSLRELVTDGVIEPLTGPASHAYLPLLAHEQSVQAQIEYGLMHTVRHLGRVEGIWLPGCGWRKGLEHTLTDVGLRYVIADRHSMDGTPAGRTVGLGPRLAAMLLAEDLAEHIWSPGLGYPGDPHYRDPQEPDGYQAIGLNEPTLYDPYHAIRRAHEHADHFLALLRDAAGKGANSHPALIPIDMQLLGPLWFEGPIWLQAVLAGCTAYPELRLTTPGAYVRAHRPRKQVTLKAGSWGSAGHGPWDDPETEAYWQAIRAAEARMIQLATAHAASDGDQERVLNQAARELLLAQSSDWPELLGTSDDHPDRQRWTAYIIRFEQLAEMSGRAKLSPGDRFVLEQLEELDGPFPQLNFRIFAR
ncbi:MAG: DUF1957 domain-containing protein [Oscillochloris sp.]|nr:DUF1957 domain-containing protein [Oscillochloris sp.]